MDDLISVRYDCRVPTSSGKVSFIITTLTNNKNRTFTTLRTLVAKAGGEMLNTGANDWLFDHVGVALIEKRRHAQGNDSMTDLSATINIDQISSDSKGVVISEEEQDEILEFFLDAGADDVDFGLDLDEHFMIRCIPNDLHNLVMKVRSQGYNITEFESRFIVKIDCAIGLDQSGSDELSKFIEKLEEDDDISGFYHTAHLNEDNNI
jgi:transcriptional/translational regulatory protein YebC/TACO1